MRQWIRDNVEHPVRWGIILLLHFSLAIGLGVDYGWQSGLCYAFVLPVGLVVIFLLYGVFGLGATVAISAVYLLIFSIPFSFGLAIDWVRGLFRKAGEERKRRKQARVICRRCGLPLSALPPEEALTLSEADIQTISWVVYKANQVTAERIAHVLADPNTRELQPGLADDLYRQVEETEAVFREMLLFILKHRVREEGWRTVMKFCRVRTMEEVEDFLMLTGDDYVDILDDFAKYGRIAAEATAAKRVLAHRGLSLDV